MTKTQYKRSQQLMRIEGRNAKNNIAKLIGHELANKLRELRKQTDELVIRKDIYANWYAFGALWGLAMKHGKTSDWWHSKMVALDGNEALRTSDMSRRAQARFGTV